jgi:hypothetical protein
LEPDASETTRSNDWSVLGNLEADPATRLAALGRLLDSPHREGIAVFLVDELLCPDRPEEWRDALVFAAEGIHFPPELRSTAADRLLAIAWALRAEPEGREKVVWSALRRGASLLEPDQMERILPFLESGLVDTRAVALQAISRTFEPHPPEAVSIKVANRVFEFASKFLDPDVFTPGEPSLIARNAVAALTAVGDPRLQAAIESVGPLNRGFLTRRIRQELERIRSGWLDRGVPPDRPAVKNVEEGLALLAPVACSA